MQFYGRRANPATFGRRSQKKLKSDARRYAKWRYSRSGEITVSIGTTLSAIFDEECDLQTRRWQNYAG